MESRRNINNIRGNERGVALLIVLLVTALLIALIFEFSYATRISLNNAVSFRDSQRAYFLARSGISAFLKYGSQIRKWIPQGEWRPLPLMGDMDTIINVMWIDQRSLININTISTFNWVQNLFDAKGISAAYQKVYDLKKGPPAGNFALLSELHAVMSDEEYDKVAEYLTTDSDFAININTASEEVLSRVLEGNSNSVASAVDTILNTRKTKEITAKGDVGLNTNTVTNSGVLNNLQVDSTIYRYYAKVNVGGYEKQVEAVVNGSAVTYWRAL